MSATPVAIIGDPIKNSSIVAEVGCPATPASQSTNSSMADSTRPGICHAANSPDGFDGSTRRYIKGSPIDRLMARVVTAPDGCWIPDYSRTANGYAQMMVNKRPIGCHRISYESLVGPIPEGLQLDHLCRNRACCNPAHLEPVTNRENCLRGMAPAIIVYRTGICMSGRHSMIDAVVAPGGGRHCRQCKLEGQRRRYALKVAL